MSRSLWSDRSGAGAAEFALVLPILTAFLFGTIDGGRYLWAVNQAEKATQMGVRMAVVTSPVASGLSSENYATTGYGLNAGDPISADKLSAVTCDDKACTCTGTCPSSLSHDDTAFTNLVARMAAIDPAIGAGNVLVIYQGSGLGFAGDPGGMQISPTITVKLRDMRFTSIATLSLVDVRLPTAAASLTAEDASGTQSE